MSEQTRTPGLLECPTCEAAAQDILGVEVRGAYDGILYWQCLKCGHAWAREWPPGSRRECMARELVMAANRHANARSDVKHDD